MKLGRNAFLIGATAVLCAGAGVYFGRHLGGGLSLAPRTTIDERVVLSVLRSEALAFLVTRRTTTQIVVQHEEASFLGHWHGVLWATVTFRWGVDIRKIADKDIRREGETLVCRLPEPELLDFGVEPGSIGFMSKSTAVPKLKEILGVTSQREKLETSLRDRAMQFAKDKSLLPSRGEITRQLNDAAATLKSAGLDVRFE